MKEETLRQMKFDFAKEVINATRYNNRIDEINSLVQDEKVKRYIELVGDVPYSSVYKSDDIEELFYGAYNRNITEIDERDTNKIFVYVGSYFVSYSGGALSSAVEVCVPRHDPRAEYRKYHDLEQYKPITVPVAKSAEFEAKNTIIFDNKDYYDIRRDFATNILMEGQKKAKKYILERYKIG